MTDRKINKKEHFFSDKYKELLTIALLVMSYVANVPLLTLGAFAIACLFVVFSNYQTSVYYLAFFTSFAGIFVYNGKHMFFLMVALFILKSFAENRASKNTFVYYLVIIAYCLVFSDFQSSFSFANAIGLILLFAIPLIAYSSDRIDCNVFMQHYILGFVIATIIGFFVKNIPSMYRLFDIDLLWTDNYEQLTRFFGLAFDSNFYALSNFIIVAYLLFAFEKITPFRGMLTLFLFITGVLTISKSYYLVAGAFVVLYIAKNLSKMKHIVVFALVALVGVGVFSIVSNNLGYNALEMIASRFVPGGSFADNTTGRTEIWKEYIEFFNTNGIKETLFGLGFNAPVVHSAHNTFIEFMFHYGLVGLILWGSYFVHCMKLFRKKAERFENKSPIVCICMIAGIFFLSAYTYEAFWIGIVISMMTFGVRKNESGEKYV